MSNKTVSASRWIIATLVMFFLAGCQSSRHFMVSQTELTALAQCQQVQQDQQTALEYLQNRVDDVAMLVGENLELQRRLAEAPPPPPVQPRPAADCPKLPPPPATPPSVIESLLQDKQLIGERERVLLTSIGVELRARVSTGITASLLDARNIQLFERNGEEWVRFTVIDRKTEEAHELERKRIRFMPGTAKEESSRRPVIEMRMTIGKLTQSVELALVDRADQANPILIGRNALRDVMIVDVSRSDLAPPVRENTDSAGDAAKP